MTQVTKQPSTNYCIKVTRQTLVNAQLIYSFSISTVYTNIYYIYGEKYGHQRQEYLAQKLSQERKDKLIALYIYLFVYNVL